MKVSIMLEYMKRRGGINLILLHKANRKDNGEEVQGILSKVWGQYLITSEDNEDDVFYVTEESIRPVVQRPYTSGSKIMVLV